MNMSLRAFFSTISRPAPRRSGGLKKRIITRDRPSSNFFQWIVALEVVTAPMRSFAFMEMVWTLESSGKLPRWQASICSAV